MKRQIAYALRWLSDRIYLHRDRCGGSIGARHDTRHWTREELVECVAEMVMSDVSGRQGDWFNHFLVQQHENKRLRQILDSRYHNDPDLNRAIHVADLEAKNKRLREHCREMQVSAERRNREAWATGLIVHCTGCDEGGPFNNEDLTEERVREVENIAARLRRWWNNHQYRKSQQSVA